MKRLVFAVGGIVLLTALVAAGCGVTLFRPAPGVVVSSCVTCHSDKDLLKQTAAPLEEEKSEATSGEG